MPYLLTFRCYGTHLPGNANGTVQRGGRWQSPSPALEQYSRRTMRQAEQHLNLADATLALAAFQHACAQRYWELIAAHVRATHVHLVADGIAEPMRAIGDLKAYATKALRQHNAGARRLYWARGGNIRWLATAEALRAAIHYVVSCQGEPMAVYQR